MVFPGMAGNGNSRSPLFSSLETWKHSLNVTRQVLFPLPILSVIAGNTKSRHCAGQPLYHLPALVWNCTALRICPCDRFSLFLPVFIVHTFINTAAAPEEQVSTLYQPLLGNLTSTTEHFYTESFDTCLKTCLWKATKILKHHPDYSSHSTVSLKSAPGNLFNTLSNFSSSQQPISKLSEDPLLFYI